QRKPARAAAAARRRSAPAGRTRRAQARGAGVVQAELVAVRVAQVRVVPAPRHALRTLRELHAPAGELRTAALELAGLEVEAHALRRRGDALAGLERVQREGAVAGRSAQARVAAWVLVDDAEPERVAVERERAAQVGHVEHRVVER